MVKISGHREHLRRLERLRGEATVRKVDAALQEGGSIIAVDAQISMTTGAQSGKQHKPSVAPNPPLADTHALVNSIQVVNVAPLQVEVFTDSPYASVHEFGSSQHPERPFFRPAVQRKRKEVVEKVGQAVSIAVRNSGR